MLRPNEPVIAEFPSPPFILASGFAGFLGYGLGLALLVSSRHKIGVAHTSLSFATAPFFGALASQIDSQVTPQLIASGLLIGLGVWLQFWQPVPTVDILRGSPRRSIR